MNTPMDASDPQSILELLRDPDPANRQVALIQLEDLASDEWVEPLLGALGDEDAVVRKLAVALLEEIGDERAVPYIIARLVDEDDEVRDAASTALRGFRGESGASAMI